MPDFGETSLDVDSLDLGAEDRVLFITVGSDPSFGAGHAAAVGTRAYGGEGTPVAGMVFRKEGSADTAWGNVSGEQAASGFNIALNSGGFCSVSVTGASFAISLNGGGTCNVGVS